MQKVIPIAGTSPETPANTGLDITEVLEGEIIPKSAGIIRFNRKNGGDARSLASIETAIREDMRSALTLDRLSALISLRLGIALNTVESLLDEGYHAWVAYKFSDAFSRRKSFYCKKLAEAFRESEAGSALQLPAFRDRGDWLAKSDKDSPLGLAALEFIGDLTLTELMEKHGVLIKKEKKLWEPDENYVDLYTQEEEHRHLRGTPYTEWPDEEKFEFRQWFDRERAKDVGDERTRASAATGKWGALRVELIEHGLERRSWALLPSAEMKETRELLADILHEMDCAMKEEE